MTAQHKYQITAFHSSFCLSLNPHLVERALAVAPVGFDLDEEFEVDAMAQQFFYVAAGARARLFDPLAAAPDDDLLLRGALDEIGIRKK